MGGEVSCAKCSLSTVFGVKMNRSPRHLKKVKDHKFSTTLKMTEDLRRKVNLACGRQNTTMSAFIETAILYYMERENLLVSLPNQDGNQADSDLRFRRNALSKP